MKELLGIVISVGAVVFSIYLIGKHLDFWDKHLPYIKSKLFSGSNSSSVNNGLNRLSSGLGSIRFGGLGSFFRRN